MFRRGTMALGCVFMFLRSGSVRFNHMGVFVHGNTPLSDLPDDPGSPLYESARPL
jgi:hypothetical protein